MDNDKKIEYSFYIPRRKAYELLWLGIFHAH